MKKLRILLLALIVLAFGLLLSGCKVDPVAKEWHIQGYIKNTVFLGGAQREIVYATATVEYPFGGVSTEKTKISFSADGKVQFSTCDGEVLEGTFVLEPALLLTFSNGETAEGKCSKTLFGGSRIEFTFRDVLYFFADHEPKEIRGEAEVIQDLRWETNPYLYDANVKIEGDTVTVTYKEDSVWEITPTTAIYAMHLDKNNVLTPLEALREGKCRMAYVKQDDYFVLYYIEPLAAEIRLFAEVETWVKEIGDADVSKIILVEEYTGTTVRTETTVTDAAGIQQIMDMLRQTQMTKIPAGQVTLAEKAQTLSILITTKDNKAFTVQTVDKYFIIGSDYWEFDNFIDPGSVK